MSETDYPLLSEQWKRGMGASLNQTAPPQIPEQGTYPGSGIVMPNGDEFTFGRAEIATPRGVTETVLERAASLADGPREAVYGHPYEHFTATGRMWGAILTVHLGIDVPAIPPEAVALMFDADKTIRLCETPGHQDSMDDKVGYVRCYEKVRDRAGFRTA